MAQVFSNLIGNALQYGTKEEPILVLLKSTRNEIIVTVNNNGPVIDSQKLATIFEPMVRLAKNEAIDYSRDLGS